MIQREMQILGQILVPVLALSGVAQTLAGVPDDATKIQPLGSGETIPAFTAYQVSGEAYVFDPATRTQPAILIFYRGGWCPYCNNQLKGLRQAEPELLSLGFEVLFLSADRPEILHSSLRAEQPTYTILSDASMEVSRSLGIAFIVDDATLTRYRKAGLDLEQVSGYDHHQLPVPAVFVVDTGGVIRFVYANPDYRVRLEPEVLLETARGMAD